MAFGGGGVAGTLSVYLNLDSSGFHQGMGQAQNSLDSFTKGARKAGKVLSAGVTAPLLVAGKAVVGWASDTEEALSAVDRTYGTAADGVVAWSETTATAHGIAQSDALQTMAVLSATGRAAGMSNQDMATWGEGLVARSADLASFYNAAGGTNEVLGAMQSALRGEFDPLERFGVRINAAMVQQRALEMGLVDSNGAVTEQGKILATNSLIMEQSEAVAGDFALTSGGLANQTRIFMATLKDSGAALGKIFLPYVTKGVAWLTKMLTAVQKLSPNMQKWIVIIAGAAAALGPLLIAIGYLLPGLGVLATVIGVVLSPIGLLIAAAALLAYHFRGDLLDAFKAVASFLTDRIKPALDAALFIFQAMRQNGINPITAALYGVAAAFDFLLGPTNAISTVFYEVGAIIGTLVDRFNEMRDAGLNPVEAAFKALYTTLASVLGLFNVLTTIAREAYQVAVQLSRAWGEDGFMGVLRAIPDVIAGIDWSAIWDGVKDVGGGLVGTFGDISIGVLSWAWTQIRNVPWARIWEVVTDQTGNILTAIGDLGKALKGWYDDALDAVDWANLGYEVGQRVGSLAGVLADKGGELIDGFGEAVQQHWKTVLRVIGLFIIALPATIGYLGKTLIPKAIEFIGGFLEGLGTSWEGVARWLALLPIRLFFAITDLAALLIPKGIELIGGLLSGLIDKWPQIAFWLNSVAMNVMKEIPSLVETLLQKGKDLLGGLKTGASNFWDETVQPWLASLPGLAVEALGALAETLKAKGGELLGGLKTGIEEKWADVSFWLSTLGMKVQQAIPSLIDSLLQKGKDLLTGLRNGLQSFADNELKAWLVGLPGWAASQIVTTGGQLAAKGGEIASALWGGVTAWLADIKWGEIPGNIVDSLVTAVKNKMGIGEGGDDGGGGGFNPLHPLGVMRAPEGGGASKLTESLSKLSGVTDQLLKPYQDAAARIGPIVDGMAATVTASLTKMRTDATAQITGLAATTTTILTAWRGAATAQVTGLAQTTTTILTAWGAAATAQVTQLAQTTTAIMTAWRGAVTAQVTQAAAAIVATLTGLRGQMGALAAAAGESFRAGIAGGMSAAVAAAASGAASVRSAASIGSLYNQGYSVGQSMGAGLADGIRSYVNVVASSAASIVNTAISAARTAAAAASPSKKMMALGDDMVEGLLIPLLAGRRDAATAMAALIQTPAFVPGLAGMAGMGARTSGVTWTGDLHVHAAPGMDEQALAERVKEEVYHGLTRSLGLQEGI